MPDLLLLLIVLLIVVLIWRGPKTLPEIGNMLGRGVKAARDEAKTIRAETNPSETTPSTPPGQASAPPEQAPRP